MKIKITLDKADSLKNKLTKSNELYEHVIKWKFNQEQKILIRNIKDQFALRKNLSYPANPPIQEIIDFYLVTDFINLLNNSYPEFQ